MFPANDANAVGSKSTKFLRQRMPGLMRLEHHWSRSRLRRRVYLNDAGTLLLLLLLLVHADAQSAHFLLDRRQHRHDRRQRVLVLRHQSPDVLDVRPLPHVILDAIRGVRRHLSDVVCVVT